MRAYSFPPHLFSRAPLMSTHKIRSIVHSRKGVARIFTFARIVLSQTV
jgi:hypothetical protein